MKKSSSRSIYESESRKSDVKLLLKFINTKMDCRNEATKEYDNGYSKLNNKENKNSKFLAS